ncbi:heme exporter protein CcmB, partial [Salmonella enterica subsp. enterica serovar Cerro]|nr:heme exporter protein CcmB [Salmonella enterica subsp. enterica serovar Cerro]
FRHGADIAGPLWFFLMVITLFPLSVGPQPQLLARIAPGIIQVVQTAKECARDVEAVLSSDSYPFFLDAMYGDMPNNWSPELSGLA